LVKTKIENATDKSDVADCVYLAERLQCEKLLKQFLDCIDTDFWDALVRAGYKVDGLEGEILTSLTRLYGLEKNGKGLFELFVYYGCNCAYPELCALVAKKVPYELSEIEFRALQEGRTDPELFMLILQFASGATVEAFVIAQIAEYNSEEEQLTRITSLMSSHLAETETIQTAIAELIADPMYSSEFYSLLSTKSFVEKCVSHANEKAIAAVLQCDLLHFDCLQAIVSVINAWANDCRNMPLKAGLSYQQFEDKVKPVIEGFDLSPFIDSKEQSHNLVALKLIRHYRLKGYLARLSEKLLSNSRVDTDVVAETLRVIEEFRTLNRDRRRMCRGTMYGK
jgi:hypothetical protein